MRRNGAAQKRTDEKAATHPVPSRRVLLTRPRPTRTTPRAARPADPTRDTARNADLPLSARLLLPRTGRGHRSRPRCLGRLHDRGRRGGTERVDERREFGRDVLEPEAVVVRIRVRVRLARRVRRRPSLSEFRVDGRFVRFFWAGRTLWTRGRVGPRELVEQVLDGAAGCSGRSRRECDGWWRKRREWLVC